MDLRVEGVGDFLRDAKHAWDYLNGEADTFTNFEFSKATPRELKTSDLANSIYKEFCKSKVEKSIEAEIDRRHGMIQLTFDATEIPESIASKFLPGGEYRKYLADYDKGSSKAVVRIPVDEDKLDKLKGLDHADFSKDTMKAKATKHKSGTTAPAAESLTLNIDEAQKVSFKDHHICQGCGKPLSSCSCEVAEEDIDLDSLDESSVTQYEIEYIEDGRRQYVREVGGSKKSVLNKFKSAHPEAKNVTITLQSKVDECMTEDEPKLDIFSSGHFSKYEKYCKINESEEDQDLDSELIHWLKKLKTEASEALSKYENLESLVECRDILYYLVNDARYTLDYVNRQVKNRKLESLELKESVDDESTTITLKVMDPDHSIRNLIDYIKVNSESGHSFPVVVDPHDSENMEEFFIDGDGSARIYSIDVQEPEVVEESLVESDSDRPLTYKEFMDLALKNYNNGGDSVYECWEEYQFDDYVKEFGPITKKVAMSIFRMYRGQYADFDESLTEKVSVKDLRAFYDTSTSIDKKKYPNFHSWYDFMVKSGKYRTEGVLTPSSEWKQVSEYGIWHRYPFQIKENGGRYMLLKYRINTGKYSPYTNKATGVVNYNFDSLEAAQAAAEKVKVFKESVDSSEVDVISLVSDHFGVTDSPYEGPSFILPDGRYLDIRSCKNHADVEYWLDQKGHSAYSDFNRRSGSPTLKSLGCIRVDTPKYYIQLPPDNISSSQYSSLKDWVDFLMSCSVPFIEVTAPGAHPVRYNFDGEIDADYVTNRVRRYYISGTLYEANEDPAETPADKLEDFSGATQPSSIGQHKVDSIDLVEAESEEYKGMIVQVSPLFPDEYEIIDPAVDKGAPVWGDKGTIQDGKDWIDNVMLKSVDTDIDVV